MICVALDDYFQVFHFTEMTTLFIQICLILGKNEAENNILLTSTKSYAFPIVSSS